MIVGFRTSNTRRVVIIIVIAVSTSLLDSLSPSPCITHSLIAFSTLSLSLARASAHLFSISRVRSFVSHPLLHIIPLGPFLMLPPRFSISTSFCMCLAFRHPTAYMSFSPFSHSLLLPSFSAPPPSNETNMRTRWTRRERERKRDGACFGVTTTAVSNFTIK